MKIAIIGAGIAGTAAAWLLHYHHDVTIYEQNRYPGGHARTVRLDGHPPIDTGFQIFNQSHYPNLNALIDYFNIETMETDLHWAVSMEGGKTEHSSRAVAPSLREEIRQFAQDAVHYLKSNQANMALGSFLKKGKYSKKFIHHHLIPLASMLWLVDAKEILHFPAKNFIRALYHQRLLHIQKTRPWLRLKNGGEEYINQFITPFKDKIHPNVAVVAVYVRSRGIEITDKFGQTIDYDHVIFACQADQARSILHNPLPDVKKMLQSFAYEINETYLHQDESFMPSKQSNWAGWNFVSSPDNKKTSVTYWLNQLQPNLGHDQNYFLTMNPWQQPETILQELSYNHPVFHRDCLQGWKLLKSNQGKQNIWFCGPWCGNGFHEDSLSSALNVAEAIGPERRPWDVKEKSPAAHYTIPVEEQL